jgi:ferrochelatase
LPATHAEFFDAIRSIQADKLIVLPLYPQFSYSTTGSIARFFDEHLPIDLLKKMEWVRSYADHPAYVESMQNCIREFLESKQIDENDAFLFFSAHGLPQKFVDEGDSYQGECELSYKAIMKDFPRSSSLLAFQSKFGPGQWLKPYTSELSKEPSAWIQDRKHVVFVPLSFTSDHLETLYEVEYTYIAEIRSKGIFAHRCLALNQRTDWIDALVLIAQTAQSENQALIRT